MNSWVGWSVLALAAWGSWGFLPKLATKYMTPPSIIIYEILAALSVGLICLCLTGFRPEIHAKGILDSSLTGVASLLGGLFYVLALARGKVSVIVTMTALYPILTIALATVILKEPITLKQGCGMILAILSMVLLASP
jgi:bacterial/archaeal transporter family protein